VTLRPDGVLNPGSEASASVEVPGEWYELFPAYRGASRIGFLAGDRISGMAMHLSRRELDGKSCPELTRTAAADAAEAALLLAGVREPVRDSVLLGTSRSAPFSSLLFDQYLWLRPEVTGPSALGAPEFLPTDSPSTLDYRVERVTRPGASPGPADYFVQGRVICSPRALVVVSCTTTVGWKSSTGARCLQVVRSLTLEGGAPPPEPVPSSPSSPTADHPSPDAG
jgi:hypothetical protein